MDRRQVSGHGVRSAPSADGLLIVDYSQSGKAIGVEITAPSAVTSERLNRLLVDLHESPLSANDYVPIRAT